LVQKIPRVHFLLVPHSAQLPSQVEHFRCRLELPGGFAEVGKSDANDERFEH
jgi:hypothetical protein